MTTFIYGMAAGAALVAIVLGAVATVRWLIRWRRDVIRATTFLIIARAEVQEREAAIAGLAAQVVARQTALTRHEEFIRARHTYLRNLSSAVGAHAGETGFDLDEWNRDADI